MVRVVEPLATPLGRWFLRIDPIGERPQRRFCRHHGTVGLDIRLPLTDTPRGWAAWENQ